MWRVRTFPAYFKLDRAQRMPSNLSCTECNGCHPISAAHSTTDAIQLSVGNIYMYIIQRAETEDIFDPPGNHIHPCALIRPTWAQCLFCNPCRPCFARSGNKIHETRQWRTKQTWNTSPFSAVHYAWPTLKDTKIKTLHLNFASPTQTPLIHRSRCTISIRQPSCDQNIPTQNTLRTQTAGRPETSSWR